MRQPVTKELYAYWRRLKGARAAPDRADIDPAAIRHILADSFIIEVDPERRFPIRLSGTRLNALWMDERKGVPFLSLWGEADRRAVAAALLTVIDGVTPIVAGARACVAGAAPLELELMLLPLRHFGKTHSRVLGSLAPVYQPEWLGIRSAGALELRSLRVVGEENAIRAGVSPGFSERAQAPRLRPALIVHEGGKLR